MNKKPLISVTVVCYNQEQTIARTIDSVLAQKTAYPFEIIIGEDASPSDNTRAICEEYALKYPNIIKLLPKEANKGVLLNLLDCLSVCNGKYIACTAGDDWWHNPDKLQLQVDFLEKNKDYGLVYTDFNTLDTDTMHQKIDCFSSNSIVPPSGYIYKELIKGNTILACTTLFRTDVFRKHIDFNKFVSLGFLMEDYPMWLEMIQHTNFKYIPVSTTTYSIANGSLSNNLNNFSKFEQFEQSVFEIKKYYISKYPIDDIDEESLLQMLYLNLLVKCVKGKHLKEARFYAKKMNNDTLKNLLLKVIIHSPLILLYSIYLNKNN